MHRPNRRAFLKGSIAAGAFAGFAIGGTKASGRILGANDAIRVGVAGLNGRGGTHVDEFTKADGVEVTYLIDPDSRTFADRVKTVENRGGKTPKTVADVRRALDDPNLDVLSIATPNHWHALMTVWACAAGKDVYVEKPCSHTVLEGRAEVEAARKHDRIVQQGTQGRSIRRWAEVAELARTGKLGKLLVSRALCYKPRPTIGLKPNSTPPAELDYDLWLGPATALPYNANYVHYNWHWFWPFGNGDIGNQGVHQMDVARWMIPGATLPNSVVSLGGRFGYEDQAETPNTLVTAFDFDGTPLIFEVRGLESDYYQGQKVGNILHFEAGVVTDNSYYPEGQSGSAPLPEVEAELGPGRGHFENFIEAVRSHKSDDLNAEILEGHRSSALCHLANISYRLGALTPADGGSPIQDAVEPLAEAIDRTRSHLADANGLDLAKLDFRVGPKLAFDPQAERFVDAPEADRMLTRTYRPPFVIPGLN